ncbi:MAG TPA: DUF1553 domain-containing protein [Tepidisphaeraceae bacterium]|jgi:hypothetical protein|nr:DUF1553 domain-containing protein [Tepidisphaeraceae bacterium]
MIYAGCVQTNMTMTSVRFATLIVAAFGALAAAASAHAGGDIQFNRDVRPILADTCFRCHGFDKNSRKAKLRLDLREDATSPRKAGTPIIAGHPEQSEAYRRLTSADPDQMMPPPASKLTLTAAQKEVIRQWIAAGAEYEPHWSLIPVKEPKSPSVKRQGWVRNGIDPFVLARLEAEGLSPSPEADRRTLIRRVSLDLTGLPPTPAEVEAFLADQHPDAYERVVDRLLASPRYGERMAMQWLDAARYADTNGYNNDEDRTMWLWRDWVIDAFNADMPYGRFVTEQIAGDLLPAATLEQKIASGFNRNHAITSEGGIIDEEYRLEYVFDRVHTTATVFLGLSMRCARCHDHKFDPITQKEFYRFAAFFNNIAEKGQLGTGADARAGAPFIKAPTREQARSLSALAAQREELKARIAQREKAADGAIPAWEKTFAKSENPPGGGIEDAAGLAAHFPLDDKKGSRAVNAIDAAHNAEVHGNPKWSADGPGGSMEFDGSTFLDAGQAVDFEHSDAWSVSAMIRSDPAAAVAIVSKMDDDAGYRGFDFILEDHNRLAVHIINQFPNNAIKVVTKEPLQAGAWHHVAMTYDGTSKAAGVHIYADGKPQALTAAFDVLSGTIKTDQPLRIGQRKHSLAFVGKISDVRVYHAALNEQAISQLGGREKKLDRARLFAVAPEKRTATERAQIRGLYLREQDPDFAKLSAELSSLDAKQAQIEAEETPTMVMAEMPTTRPTYVLGRGEYDKPGEVVTPGVPASLPAMPAGAPMNRLGLAQWMVDPGNPLVDRVAVNRLWELVFGTGIVETLEDFGVQGDPPSHPELLDWLALQLRGRNGSTKAVLRLIVTSAAYRQSSNASAELVARDPKNRLLARGPRFRMDAELVRDNALAASGLLYEKLGGPSVKPYQPAGLWEEVSVDHRASYAPAKGNDLYRRSLYTFLKRTCPPPGPTALDAPGRDTCVVRRARTNTPLQALVLMNDPTYVEAARKLAERMTAGGPNFEAGLSVGFELLLAREPTAAERAILAPIHQEALARFRADRAAATKLLSVGESPRDRKLDEADLAAWATVAGILLDMDETITKE